MDIMYRVNFHILYSLQLLENITLSKYPIGGKQMLNSWIWTEYIMSPE